MSAVANIQEAKPIDTVRGALERMKGQFAMALPKHLTPDRLLRVALTAVQNTPKLLECDRTSLYSAIMTCAQLGLEPDGVLGQAYLVPYAGKVQFIPGYKGLISLARNSGDVVSISAHEVCEHDTFDYAFGLAERLEHVPAKGDRGEVAYFYAYAKFKDGGHHFDVMTREDVETIRDNSEGWKSAVASAKKYGKPNKSPWFTSFVEMGKKTAIRRIAKYLPLSVQKAAAMADALDSGKHAHIDRYGDVVIDTTATQQIGTEGQIENAGGGKLDRFETAGDSPKDGEVLSPDDAEISDPVGAPEESHDPETGEIQNGSAEPVEFWQRESLEIVPVAVGKSHDWNAWQPEIMKRIAEAASLPDLDALERMNVDHISLLSLKYQRNGEQVKAAFVARRAALSEIEG